MKVVEAALGVGVEETDSNNAYAVVKALMNRSFPEYDLNKIFGEIDISKHAVMDPMLRKDKDVFGKKSKPKGEKNQNLALGDPLSKEKVTNDDGLELLRKEKITRIPLALQKLICNKRVSFCLANPAIRTYRGGTDAELQPVKEAIETILFDNDIPLHDKEAARETFTFTEVLEYWHTEDLKTRNTRYGFDTDKKIRVNLLKRSEGYSFYPLKDENGNMICISYDYERKQPDGKLVKFFVAATDEQIVKYKRTGGFKWEIVGTPFNHELGLIPMNFAWQQQPEYQDVKDLIAQLEKILSNHGEINSYHAAPKLFLTDANNVTGFGSKEESGMVLQGTGKADAKYLSWADATASVKLEIDNLLMQIYAITQTPNISFDNLKGLGAVSGVSIKLMFMDAHLAVKDKETILIPYFRRRFSILRAFIKFLEPSYAPIVDKLEVASVLDPFMIADDYENAQIAQIQNGNQAVKSQETTVMEAGGDKAELDRILAETKDRNISVLTEPTSIEI